MKVFLMFRNQDFDTVATLPNHFEDLVFDFELEVIFNTMAKKDEFLYKIAKKAFLASLTDIDTILYRQEILKDCIENEDVLRTLYDISVRSIEFEKKAYFLFFNKYPESVLHSSVRLMEMFLGTLKELKNVASQHKNKFRSEGFIRFFSMIEKELNDEYFSLVKKHLKNLEFNSGMLISAKLGRGNKGVDYVLRKPYEDNKNFVEKLLSRRKDSYVLSIHERDEAGAKALSELRSRGVNSVANAVFKSAKHILNFFEILRSETAFYIGTLNLYKTLKELGNPTCFPKPMPQDSRNIKFKNLRDAGLSLILNKSVVGNDLDTNNREISLFIITGANQGGKSTFLRSVGLAKLMMQCGMFVLAEEFSSNINAKIFTHYKRKEDETMESGKFDEEMKRMKSIIDEIDKNSLIMFNESFSSTNEIEGSEISKQIAYALLEYGVEMFFVTHLYKFADDLYSAKSDKMLFLRAQREDDGTRTYKVEEGKPLETSYGKDIYRKIFE